MKSLRDVFIVVSLIAMAMAAMRVGGIFCSAALFVIWFLVTLRSIVAVVGTSSDRIAARGFVIPIFLYVACLVSIGASEFRLDNPFLFTSQFLARLNGNMGRELNVARMNEYMSLGHGIAALMLGTIGTFFATAVDQARESEKNDDS